MEINILIRDWATQVTFQCHVNVDVKKHSNSYVYICYFFICFKKKISPRRPEVTQNLKF